MHDAPPPVVLSLHKIGDSPDFCRKYKKNPPIELRTALYYPKIRLSQLFRVNTGPYNRPTNQ